MNGDTRVWIRGFDGTYFASLRELGRFREGCYWTPTVNTDSLEVGWSVVVRRALCLEPRKRGFRIRLERGQELGVSEDEPFFTIDPTNARIVPVKARDLAIGMPVIAPYDLSTIARVWERDLATIDLRRVLTRGPRAGARWTVFLDGECLTNRLRSTRLPIDFPVSDDFLYVVGLWLAEGGKSRESPRATLQFSVGAIPGAVNALKRFFCSYNAPPCSKGNGFDCSVQSSVFAAVFEHLGLFGTAKRGDKRFPAFFWNLSQRQRRTMIAGLWDGDGSHVFHGQSVLAQKSHALIHDVAASFLLDGIFPIVKPGRHSQLLLFVNRARDFRILADTYPFGHVSKRLDYQYQASRQGRDKATGLWKCSGIWDAVGKACLPPGERTRIYNRGGKYDRGVRAQRSAFRGVPALRSLADSKLAFLRVAEIDAAPEDDAYELCVGTEDSVIANGVLVRVASRPECQPNRTI